MSENQKKFGVQSVAPAVDANQGSIVITRTLTKTYGKGATRVEALKAVDLTVKKGEFVAVQGPSGSGKTTFLNMIGALDRPTKGRVIIDGVETSKVPERDLYKVRREKLGFIFQTYYLIPTLSAIQNVLVPVMPIDGSKKYHVRATQLLELVGLKERMHHKPNQLSGGEQQRVAIARALIMDPSIILADEPTGNLDTRTGANIMDLMQQLNREHGKTLIVVTHDRRIADSRADRVVYLFDGQLYNAPPEDF